MKLKASLLLLSLVAFASCTTKETKTLVKNGYSITYPASLTLDEKIGNGLEFALFYPEDKKGDNFVENINLLIQDISKDSLNLDQYVKLTKNQIMRHGSMLSSKTKSKNDMQYQVLEFVTPRSDFDLRFIQYDILKDGKAYVLTFSGKKTDYNSYRESAEKILESFVLE